MMNFVLNFECLFWFLFQLTLTSDLKEVQFTQNYLFWVKAPLQYLEGAPNFKTLPWLKNINNNKYSKFDTRLVIWRPVEMTWSRPLNQGGGGTDYAHHIATYSPDFQTFLRPWTVFQIWYATVPGVMYHQALWVFWPILGALVRLFQTASLGMEAYMCPNIPCPSPLLGKWNV